MYATVRPNPGWQARQAAAPVGGMGKAPFDLVAIVQQLVGKCRKRVFGQLDGTKSTGGLLVVTDAALAAVAPACDQL